MNAASRLVDEARRCRRAVVFVVVSFMIAVCAVTSACNNGGVTSPDAPGSSYSGEWSGTTSQGASISFIVSATQTVTAMTISHRFNGCTGSQTFSNLSLDIGQSTFPPRVPTSANQGFGYGSGSPEEANYTQVSGTFTSNRTATGSLIFLNFSSCGNAVAAWNATKR